VPDKVVIKGTLVVLTLHHFLSFYWPNIEHAAEAMLPVFDALHQLEAKNLIPPMSVTGVLLHQVPKKHKTHRTTDFFKEFFQLLLSSKTFGKVYFQDDLEKGHICAEKVILLDRQLAHEAGIMQRTFFTDLSSANMLKQRAVQYYGINHKMLSRLPGRRALFIARYDSQGVRNTNPMIKLLDNSLANQCWDLHSWSPTQSDQSPLHRITLKNQIEKFLGTDLSISVHGAHLTNLMWQMPQTGVLIILKCNFRDLDFPQLASETGVMVFKSTPIGCGPPEPPSMNFLEEKCRIEPRCNHSAAVQWSTLPRVMMRSLPDGREFPEIHKDYSVDFEKELEPVLVDAINQLEMIANRGPRCRRQHQTMIP